MWTGLEHTEWATEPWLLTGEVWLAHMSLALPRHRGIRKQPTSHLSWFSPSVSGSFRSCLCLTVCLTEMVTTHFWLPVSYNIPCTWQQPCLFCCLHDEGSQLSWDLETSNPIPKHRLVNGHLSASPRCKSHYVLPFSPQGFSSQFSLPRVTPEQLQPAWGSLILYLPYSWALLPDAALISLSLTYFTICHCLWSTFVIHLSLWVIQLLCCTWRDSDSVYCGGVAQTLLYQCLGTDIPQCSRRSLTEGSFTINIQQRDSWRIVIQRYLRLMALEKKNYSPKVVWFPASDTEASRHRIALLIAYCEGDLGLRDTKCLEIIHFIRPYEKAGKSSYIFQNTGPAWGHVMFWSFEHHHSWLSLGTASFQRH